MPTSSNIFSKGEIETDTASSNLEKILSALSVEIRALCFKSAMAIFNSLFSSAINSLCMPFFSRATDKKFIVS